MIKTGIAIVGCGPIGALLANLLGRSGHRVLVLEREADVYHLPRAAHFDGEIMRAFQAADLVDKLAPCIRAGYQGMQFVNAAGALLLERSSSAGEGPQGYARSYYFHQPDMERVLRDGLNRFSNVRLLSSSTVLAAQDCGDCVLIDVRVSDQKEITKVQAQYVVGCDGARSLIRQQMDSKVEDLGLHQPWLVVDVLLKRVVDLPEHTVQHCDPARPRTYVNMIGNRRRWELMLLPGEDPAEMMSEDMVWRLLSPTLTRDDATIERAVVYTFHSVIAQGWRVGRLMIAGDAAHQTPPFLGQGLCAGVRDAMNLAWKLDRVVTGQSRDALLDTYETERAPHVRSFIELAVRLGNIIQTTDPQLAALRDLKFAEAPEVFTFPLPILGAGCVAAGSRHAGSVFAQPRIRDGRRLDDVLGSGFSVLLRTQAADLTGQLLAFGATTLRVVCASADDALDLLLGELQVDGVLLRPDRYVFGGFSSADELGAVLDQLRERLRLRDTA